MIATGAQRIRTSIMKDGVERLAIVNAPTTSMAEIVPSTALHLLAFPSPTAAMRIALSQASRPNIAVVMRAIRLPPDNVPVQIRSTI